MSDNDLIRRGDALASCQGMDPEGDINAIPAVQPTVSPELLATTHDVAELVTLLARAKEELRMIRMKDSGAVYDVLLRNELDAALARVKGVM